MTRLDVEEYMLGYQLTPQRFRLAKPHAILGDLMFSRLFAFDTKLDTPQSHHRTNIPVSEQAQNLTK
jgi:hypothetical protein